MNHAPKGETQQSNNAISVGHLDARSSRIGVSDMTLVGLLSLLVITHVLQATLSFWWDEAFTISNFVDLGAVGAWLADYHSNNHRLFSMLSAISRDLFGSSEVAYRLPSFGAALAGYAILSFQVRRYIGRAEALSVGAILVSSPLLLYWVPQARGYGLTIFASVLVLTAGLALVSSQGEGDRNRKAMALLLVGGIAGTATLPHFAVPFTLTCAVLAISKRERWRSISIAWASVGIASVAFYLPARLSRVAGVAGGTGGPRVDYLDVIMGPFRFQLVGTLSDAGQLRQLIPASWVSIAVAILVAATVLAFIRAYRDHKWTPLLLAVVPIFGTYIVAVVLGLTMTDRTMLFLFPQMSLMFALGIGYFLRPRGEHPAWLWLRRIPLIAILPVLAFLSFQLALDWAALPIERYREAANVATRSDASNIITDSARSLGFSHYAPEVVVLDESALKDALCETSNSYAYIEHGFRRGFTPPLDCLHDREAIEIVLQQRRRGSMSVWIVPEPNSQE